MVNKKRLAETFKFLSEIGSVSKKERAVSDEIIKIFEPMGAEILIDGAGDAVGSNTGNLIVRFDGTLKAPPLLFNAHMDTVEPGNGITVMFKNGIFTSDGNTILGADDKSAIAILIEAVRVLQESEAQYGPVELVFTICEEIGLLGAKHLDWSLITAKYGYVLDATDTESIVTRAPAANRFEFRIHGKDAHSGSAPEKGINAIFLASKAIAGLALGRIDHETTCNIGLIEGGRATNIVPDLVTIKGEVRSHDEEKLNRVTSEMVASVKGVVDNYKKLFLYEGLPQLEVTIDHDFSFTNISNDHPVVMLARKAAVALGRTMSAKTTGGCADANIFFEKGIITGVLGTGMRDVHTLRESVGLDDMVRTVELLLEIIKLNAKTGE